ncbi:APC family permease [Granulicella arctica]|uniref:APC family permease n=1 Tax=Granulicella arctica TaxID=940613 RepID=UPI0021E07BFA|nr:amino acid permease [Granulicella arctica]
MTTRPIVPAAAPRLLKRQLGFFDASMIVVGVMIGSGIFIVPANMARVLGSPGWLLLAWVFAGVLTVSAAISFGELSSMMPGAGGMYLYLSEAYSPLWGFLYGWTFFTVIQTGSIAAVAVAFARFSGVLFPWISEAHYLVHPIGLSAHYAISLSTAQMVALGVILMLTGTNALGLKYGKWVQNLFTVAKIAALAALIIAGFTIGRSAAAVHQNFAHLFAHRSGSNVPEVAGAIGLLVALCVAQSGSLFSADSWHNVTFAAEEVRDPRKVLPRALILGSVLVIALYLAANIAYLSTLSFAEIQGAAHDRVATAMLEKIFPSVGGRLMALAIMISTFGCINSLILAGARAYYAMARDGLFLPAAAKLNRANVPGASLGMQAVWAGLLVLLTTYSAKAGYGNLYSDLLDYVISAALIFYILTIAAVVVLRWKKPEAERPYRTFGYPVTPIIYVVGASAILVCLFVFRPATTWPGLAIVASGAPVYFLIRRRHTSDSS